MITDYELQKFFNNATREIKFLLGQQGCSLFPGVGFVPQSAIRHEIVFYVISNGFVQRCDVLIETRGSEPPNVRLGEVLVFSPERFRHFDVFDLRLAFHRGEDRSGEFIPSMRLAMILLGTALVSHFSWMLYLFGAFLVFTGAKMALEKTKEFHPEKHTAMRLFRRLIPMTPNYHEDRFIVRLDGRWMATPLLAVLVLVEVSDLIFAVDSIPAIFGVTRDPFIVYTSNVFAILGLRSLYFVLARAIHLFHYLKPGLASVLVFIGVKMLLAETAWKIGTVPALLVVASILGIAVAASLLCPKDLPTTEPSSSATLSLTTPKNGASCAKP